jgi:hypothetical protein
MTMKFSATIRLFAAAWLAIAFVSCTKEENRDALVNRDISPGNFNTIEVNGVYDIYIIQDTVCSVEVEGIKKRVEKTSAAIHDSTLVVETSRRGEFLHPGEPNTKLFIHVDTLKRINVNEACHIRTRNALSGHEIGIVVKTRMMEADLDLACDVFYYWNNPNGSHLNLAGNVSELKLWNAGLSSVDASGLTTNYALVENGSQGECRVKATQTLEYSLTNTGNIYYYGNPPVVLPLAVSGTGQLIKAD